MSELEVALAQVFRRKGKSKMPEKDFVFAVSLDFRWFTPKEAQRLLELGIAADLLAVEGGMVRPNFDYKAVDIPKGYEPASELLQKPAEPKGLFLKIVEAVAAHTGTPTKDLIALVNRTQDEMGIDIEVAALVVARQYGMDVSEHLDSVEEGLGKKYRK